METYHCWDDDEDGYEPRERSPYNGDDLDGDDELDDLWDSEDDDEDLDDDEDSGLPPEEDEEIDPSEADDLEDYDEHPHLYGPDE